MARVLQISDTHLSHAKPQFAVNWPPLRDWVRQQHADLVIHTGDLTVDGADQEDDMRHGATLMRDLGARVAAVPGNHDVGEARNRFQPVNDARLARWRRHFGADWWFHDVEAWRLVGLDSMLFGSGLQEEARQTAWLRATLASAGARRVAWFTHRPLFIQRPDEGDAGYWCVEPEQRAPLLDLIRRHDGRAGRDRPSAQVARHDAGRLPLHLGPILGLPRRRGQPARAARREMARRGGVRVRRNRRRRASRRGPGLTDLWIDDVLHDVYPPRHAA
jgi:hypothetical protein